MKMYKIVLSFLLVAQSNVMFGMDKQNWIEVACGFVYGDRLGVVNKACLVEVDSSSVTNGSVAPCNTPSVFFQAEYKEELVDYTRGEMNAYAGSPQKYNEEIQKVVNKQEYGIICDGLIAPPGTPDSPTSVVAFHPWIVVQKTGFGNKPLEPGSTLKSILKRTRTF